MTNRRPPERTCLACNEKKPKKELIRILREPDGSVTYDLTGKKNGRGAYVCPKKACIQKLMKSGRASRELSTEVPAEVFEALLNEPAVI